MQTFPCSSSQNLLRCMSLLLVHYDITRRRINLVANGAKRTLSRVYEYTAWFGPHSADTTTGATTSVLVRKRWRGIHQAAHRCERNQFIALADSGSRLLPRANPTHYDTSSRIIFERN